MAGAFLYFLIPGSRTQNPYWCYIWYIIHQTIKAMAVQKSKRVYIAVSEYGEILSVSSNMKKCYDWLYDEKELEWLDFVNYSYFTRVLNQKDNDRFWEFRRRGCSFTSKIKFIQREVL